MTASYGRSSCSIYRWAHQQIRMPKLSLRPARIYGGPSVKGRLSPVGLRAPPVLKDGLKAPPNGLAAPKRQAAAGRQAAGSSYFCSGVFGEPAGGHREHSAPNGHLKDVAAPKPMDVGLLGGRWASINLETASTNKDHYLDYLGYLDYYYWIIRAWFLC